MKIIKNRSSKLKNIQCPRPNKRRKTHKSSMWTSLYIPPEDYGSPLDSFL